MAKKGSKKRSSKKHQCRGGGGGGGGVGANALLGLLGRLVGRGPMMGGGGGGGGGGAAGSTTVVFPSMQANADSMRETLQSNLRSEAAALRTEMAGMHDDLLSRIHGQLSSEVTGVGVGSRKPEAVSIATSTDLPVDTPMQAETSTQTLAPQPSAPSGLLVDFPLSDPRYPAGGPRALIGEPSSALTITGLRDIAVGTDRRRDRGVSDRLDMDAMQRARNVRLRFDGDLPGGPSVPISIPAAHLPALPGFLQQPQGQLPAPPEILALPAPPVHAPDPDAAAAHAEQHGAGGVIRTPRMQQVAQRVRDRAWGNLRRRQAQGGE